MKKILKAFLFILTFLLMILLSVDIIICTIRNINKKYISKENIHNMIDKVDINQVLNEKLQEVEEIKVIEEKLVEAGIPKDLVSDILISAPVKEVTAEITSNVVDYVFYNKKIDYSIDTDQVYNFIEEKLPIVSAELQEKNIPKSEYLTEENQEKILSEIKKKVPFIEENINKVVNKIEDEIKNNESVSEMNEILSIIRLIYSNKVSILLIGIFGIIILLIAVTRRSFIKSINWIGISFFISSIILFILKLIIPQLINNIKDLPDFINELVLYFMNDFINNLNIYIFIYIIIAMILIIIKMIYNKKTKKQQDEFI